MYLKPIAIRLVVPIVEDDLCFITGHVKGSVDGEVPWVIRLVSNYHLLRYHDIGSSLYQRPRYINI